jgi:hypothetical protein
MGCAKVLEYALVRVGEIALWRGAPHRSGAVLTTGLILSLGRTENMPKDAGLAPIRTLADAERAQVVPTLCESNRFGPMQLQCRRGDRKDAPATGEIPEADRRDWMVPSNFLILWCYRGISLWSSIGTVRALY